MANSSPPFFILGAGFGADAGRTVGPIDAESIYIGRYQFQCAYPLLGDLPRVCFPDCDPPVPAADVERRLAESIANGVDAPLERLCQELAKADYYLAPALVGWPQRDNAYLHFFTDFDKSSFATYNYDAFVEFALFRAGRWLPHDGFGLPVAVDLGFTADPYELRDSRSVVLHLHGTYMVYEYDHDFGPPDKGGVRWMELFERSRFAFDPHSLGNLFYPCERVMAGLAYRHELPERIVAPIPSKATGLQAEFIKAVSQRAEELITTHSDVVVIGYSFAESDAGSYSRLLRALGESQNPRVVIVSPEAKGIVARLSSGYGNVEWVPIELGFAAWVSSGYPGLDV